MYQQSVKGKPVSSLQGIMLIVLIILSIYLCDLLATWVGNATGFEQGTIAVWLVIGAEAVWIARRFVMWMRYTLVDGQLHIERLYGQSSRIVLTLNTCDIREIGGVAELRGKYASAKEENLILKDNPQTATAIAFKKEAETRLLVFQPDEELLGKLQEQKGLKME